MEKEVKKEKECLTMVPRWSGSVCFGWRTFIKLKKKFEEGKWYHEFVTIGFIPFAIQLTAQKTIVIPQIWKWKKENTDECVVYF